MNTDVPKSTAPDFCRHPRIGEDGFCIDCGARAAIKLNIPKPTPCFQCGDPLCVKEEHMLRGTHSPFANSEHPTSGMGDISFIDNDFSQRKIVWRNEPGSGIFPGYYAEGYKSPRLNGKDAPAVTKPRDLSTSTDELKSDINWGLRQIVLIELLREVFKAISHATHRVNKTPPPTKGLTTWECMPDCLKCRIGTVLDAAEN